MKFLAQFSLVISTLFILPASYAFQLSIESAGKLPQEISKQLLVLVPEKRAENTYLAATSTGNIFRVNPTAPTQQAQQIFSFSHVQANANSLSALTLHPSFSLRDQPGYGVFYTAHVEPASPDKKYLIVRDEYVDRAQISHHAVITEWQLDDSRNTDLSTQREIIRIAVPNNKATIRALSFNTTKKVWNDDYGLMLVALDPVKDWQESPLYSGAILQINPEKFGLKNYTVPVNNPFIKDKAIPAELWAYGLPSIQQLTWQSDDSKVIIDSYKADIRQLSKIEIGSNGKTKINHLYQIKNINLVAQPSTINQMHSYHGKQLKTFWNHIMFSHKSESGWQLNTIANRGEQQQSDLIWPFDSTRPLQLFSDHQSELLILDAQTGELSKLINLAIPGEEEVNPSQAPAESSSRIAQMLLLAILSLLIAFGVYRLITKMFATKNSVRHFLHKQFVKVIYEPSLKQLLLYKHHDDAISEKVSLSDLNSFSLMLNDNELFTCDSTTGLTLASESMAKEKLALAKREKLQEDTQRKLTLKLTISDAEDINIYLYLRKGNNRLTRSNYQQVADEALNICWQLSQIIAPQTTEQRPAQVKKPSNYSLAKNMKTKQTSVTKATQATTEKAVHQNTEIEPSISNGSSTKASVNSAKTDAELITALEKLVKLKEQNYLTEQEFEQAKAKLLQQLI